MWTQGAIVNRCACISMQRLAIACHSGYRGSCTAVTPILGNSTARCSSNSLHDSCRARLRLPSAGAAGTDIKLWAKIRPAAKKDLLRGACRKAEWEIAKTTHFKPLRGPAVPPRGLGISFVGEHTRLRMLSSQRSFFSNGVFFLPTVNLPQIDLFLKDRRWCIRSQIRCPWPVVSRSVVSRFWPPSCLMRGPPISPPKSVARGPLPPDPLAPEDPLPPDFGPLHV